jgi:hypothetical protein
MVKACPPYTNKVFWARDSRKVKPVAFDLPAAASFTKHLMDKRDGD